MEKFTKIPKVEDLHHRVTSLEQRVKTMEAGLQNMKPELGAAPSDKEALDRVVATQQELQTALTEAKNDIKSLHLDIAENKAYIIADDIRMQNIEKMYNQAKMMTKMEPEKAKHTDPSTMKSEANDDYIAKEKCNNCKSFPCLDKKSVTLDNIVNGAYFKGYLKSGHVHGYTQINGLNNYQVKWIKFSAFPCTDFTQTQEFSKNVQLLEFSCKT